MRLRLLGVCRRSSHLDQILHVRNALESLKLVAFCGRGKRDLLTVAEDLLKKRTHARKRFHLRQVLRFEELAPELGQFLPFLFQFLRRQKNWQQLVATLADLATYPSQLKFEPKLAKGLLPGLGMQIDRVEDGAVDVKNHCSLHRVSRYFVSPTDFGSVGTTTSIEVKVSPSASKKTMASFSRR